MKWGCFLAICLISGFGIAEEAPFVNALSLGAGRSLNDVSIVRLGLIKDSDCRFLSSDIGWFSLYYETSFNFWKKRQEEVYGGAFSPVFFYAFGNKANSVHPYIEGGIGLACITDTQIGDRDLATAFQFEDRLGFGVRVKSTDFNIRYMHYSNGSIAEPNDGMDVLIFTMAYRF